MTLPKKYHFISEDILGDIFYLEGISNRGRMTLIRQYTEIICRIILQVDDYFTLGQFEQKLTTLIPNAVLKDKIVSCVKIIGNLGNSATHVDKKFQTKITDGDCQKALEELNFLISYLFINYFNKYGVNRNQEALSIVSLLPPFIRLNIWENMYAIDSENITIIDKLFLSKLKSEGKEQTLLWLENNKGILKELFVIDIQQLRINGMTETRIQELIDNAPYQNMYDLCLKYKLPDLEQQFPNLEFPYKTFEQAKIFYLEKKQKCYSNILKSEVQELIDLMDFVYTGRQMI